MKQKVGSFAPELVSGIGKAVGAFIHRTGIKSEYVRQACGFNAARFAPFKRGEQTYLSPSKFVTLMRILRASAPEAFDHFWEHDIKELLTKQDEAPLGPP